jgi:3-oxoacyl-[acyl-carrier-protein] synthase-3
MDLIEYFLPAHTLTNNDLEKEYPDWSASKIEEKIGIRERHIAGQDETALDLAYEAALKAFAHFDKRLIDFILLCTQSPDFILPTSACILQDKLGLRTNIGAIDYNQGCSGFVYGLAFAKSLIKTRIADHVLLITAETYSKHISPSDRANRSIFGDGAAATVVSKNGAKKIFDFELGTDGSGKDNLIVINGGSRHKLETVPKEWTDDAGNIHSNNYLFMNGPEIFNFTIEKIPNVVNKVLEKNLLKIDDVDYVIFHQANKYMLDYLRKKINISKDKFCNNMLHVGNTVSSTIPIAIKECLDNKIIKAGDKVLLVGFGVGYSWGGTVIEI